MQIEELNNYFEMSDTTAELLLDDILKNHYDDNKIIVNNNIYNDTNIDDWIKTKPTTKGGVKIIEKIIKTPINDKKLLLNRQKVNFQVLKSQLEILKKTEKDLLWIMTLKEEIDDDISINLLFPSTYIINYMNYNKYLLDFYHFYKIVVMPSMNLLYPISIIYTPYYYVNKYMHFNMSFIKYLSIIYEFFKLAFKLSGNLKVDLTKLLTIFAYFGIYIYSIYQTFNVSYIIYKLRQKLLDKLYGLIEFIKTSINIIKSSQRIWKPFFLYQINDNILDMSINNLSKLDNDISSVYRLWKNANYREDIINLLKIIYTIDCVDVITKFKFSENWCIPTYENTKTQLWNCKNPLLSPTQIPNPVNLSKNIIITGVNAGGKTTYVKSITINIILAQTLGIVNAIKGNVYLYDAITSFMRISDELGKKSYFEAETSYCNEMITTADNLNKINKRGLFLMDEPMHSTPPIEGVAVAFSVAEYLAKVKGMTLIITTHFHNLIDLEKIHKDLFINLSVNANYNEKTNNYDFNYKINKGGSKQIIAIELLEKNKFNKTIINSAIEMKNKLYNESLRNANI
jgi:predicted ATPase